MRPLKNNENLSAASIQKIKPYQYIHIYKCLIESRVCQTWVEYPMFCDCPDPGSRENKAELKRRFGFTYRGFQLVKFKVLSSRRNNA